MSRTNNYQTQQDVPAGAVPQSAPAAPPAPSALDSRTFAIGVLSVTACVLLVGLILLAAAPPHPAHAAGQNDRAGDYILVTQQVSDSTEVVGVIDAAARQMVYYVFDPNREAIEFVARVPLDQMPSPQPREPEPRPRRR